MLQTIRDYTQGWIAGTIISIIILTFALWGIHSYFQGGPSNTNVASVNGTEITKEQLASAYERMHRQLQAQYGSNLPAAIKDEATLKNRALQALVDIEVLKQASYAEGFRVYNAQIDNYLQSMPEFQVDGQFSVERFNEILSSTLLSTSEFLDLIRTSLLIDQPKLGIVLTSFALPLETEYTIALVNQERDIAYTSIPSQFFLSKISPIPASNIQKYYEQHQKEFMAKEQVSIQYLELSLNDVAAKIMPTDVILKNAYNENVNSYTKPTEWKFAMVSIPISTKMSSPELNLAKQKAEKIQIALKNVQKKTAEFAKIIRDNSAKYSEEEYKPLAQIPLDLQKTISELTTVGQVSAPIKTENAFVVVKLLGIQQPTIMPFDAVKDKVKEAYIRQHAEEKFAEMREQLANLSYEHPDSLEIAAKSLNLPIKTSAYFSKDGSAQDIAQSKKVRDIAFSHDVLNLQNNSDTIQLTPETVIVLRVQSHLPVKRLALSSVSKQIEDKLKAQEAEMKIAQLAENIKTQLQSGKDPQDVVKAYQLIWNQPGLLGRYSTKINSAILDAAFRLPNPANHQNKPVYDVARLPNGAYAVLALKSVKPGSADSKQYAVFAEQMQNSEGVLEYELYKLSQMKQAKIEVMQ